MNYNLKYLLSGIFVLVFIGFLVWMRYFNQRKEEEHSDVSFEARLDSEVKALYKQLGLGEEPHYFLAYRYLHPWFNLAILPPTVEIFLTKIALVMVTPDELLIRNLGNGMTFISEHYRDLPARTYPHTKIRDERIWDSQLEKSFCILVIF